MLNFRFEITSVLKMPIPLIPVTASVGGDGGSWVLSPIEARQ